MEQSHAAFLGSWAGEEQPGRRLCNNSSNTGVLEGQLEANVTVKMPCLALPPCWRKQILDPFTPHPFCPHSLV